MIDTKNRLLLSVLLIAAVLGACEPSPDTSDVSADSTVAQPMGVDTTEQFIPVLDSLVPASFPQPYVERGVCPFECCVYQDWLAREPLRVYRTERDTSEVAFTLAEGEEFEGITGNVYVDPVGVAVVTDTVMYGPNDARERLIPGDTLYVLSHLGEGVFHMWHEGRVKEVYAFWGVGGIELGGPKGELIREPETEWWAQVRNQAGETGWLHMDTIGGKIGRIDACAGPE